MNKRRLPQWYLDKVNMAREAFTGSPDYVDLSRPYVRYDPTGQGVSAQRKGYVAPVHMPATRERGMRARSRE